MNIGNVEGVIALFVILLTFQLGQQEIRRRQLQKKQLIEKELRRAQLKYRISNEQSFTEHADEEVKDDKKERLLSVQSDSTLQSTLSDSTLSNSNLKSTLAVFSQHCKGNKMAMAILAINQNLPDSAADFIKESKSTNQYLLQVALLAAMDQSDGSKPWTSLISNLSQRLRQPNSAIEPFKTIFTSLHVPTGEKLLFLRWGFIRPLQMGDFVTARYWLEVLNYPFQSLTKEQACQVMLDLPSTNYHVISRSLDFILLHGHLDLASLAELLLNLELLMKQPSRVHSACLQGNFIGVSGLGSPYQWYLKNLSYLHDRLSAKLRFLNKL